jgi:hypothetical protein
LVLCFCINLSHVKQQINGEQETGFRQKPGEIVCNLISLVLLGWGADWSLSDLCHWLVAAFFPFWSPAFLFSMLAFNASGPCLIAKPTLQQPGENQRTW